MTDEAPRRRGLSRIPGGGPKPGLAGRATLLNRVYPVELARRIRFPAMLYLVLFTIVLFVALGLCGAIQHRAGMQTAKNMIANRDADALIFEIADFGVVGDVFTVVPQLIAALEVRGSR